jgi:hypothetical protein
MPYVLLDAHVRLGGGVHIYSFGGVDFRNQQQIKSYHKVHYQPWRVKPIPIPIIIIIIIITIITIIKIISQSYCVDRKRRNLSLHILLPLPFYFCSGGQVHRIS